MSDDEIKAIEKFKTLNIKHFNLETIYENDLLSYYDGILILNLIEKQQDELSKKDKEYAELYDELTAEKQLNVKRLDISNRLREVINLMAEDMATDYHSKEWIIKHYTERINDERNRDKI